MIQDCFVSNSCTFIYFNQTFHCFSGCQNSAYLIFLQLKANKTLFQTNAQVFMHYEKDPDKELSNLISVKIFTPPHSKTINNLTKLRKKVKQT